MRKIVCFDPKIGTDWNGLEQLNQNNKVWKMDQKYFMVWQNLKFSFRKYIDFKAMKKQLLVLEKIDFWPRKSISKTKIDF